LYFALDAIDKALMREFNVIHKLSSFYDNSLSLSYFNILCFPFHNCHFIVGEKVGGSEL